MLQIQISPKQTPHTTNDNDKNNDTTGHQRPEPKATQRAQYLPRGPSIFSLKYLLDMETQRVIQNIRLPIYVFLPSGLTLRIFKNLSNVFKNADSSHTPLIMPPLSFHSNGLGVPVCVESFRRFLAQLASSPSPASRSRSLQGVAPNAGF